MAQTRRTRSTGTSKKAAAAKPSSPSRPKKATRQESGAAAAQLAARPFSVSRKEVPRTCTWMVLSSTSAP